MNVSHEVRWVWWAPGRCATRSVYAFLSQYDFVDMSGDTPPGYPGRADGYTHNLGVPYGCENYRVMMQVRNPYSRLVSMWRLECLSDYRPIQQATTPFADFAKTRNSLDLSMAYRTKTPDMIIRQETLSRDLAVVPFVDLTDTVQRSMFDRFIVFNRYTGGDIFDWRLLYNNRLADLVYESNRAAFEDLGYDRYSWRAGR